MLTVDACGLSCPEPMLRLKNALQRSGEVALTVDSKTALANCTQYAKEQEYAVDIQQDADKYTLHVRKG